MKTYTFSVSKALSGTIDIEAESQEEAWEKANDGDWDEAAIEINENDSAMGLDDWMIEDLIEIDGEDL